ncbi:LacI family DNA-binding transcriptional regulator [Entomohabitans teleogrylli]|uniref:LacI family DNA-binding transcriptional regulator n=1 Tax=Entomohabitans teleogrylli TaxID=1384589 RepID=UPI00073D6687|nr:LacI family DNA-binding transcriptional regulator [Entomohabitans teleogrylli]
MAKQHPNRVTRNDVARHAGTSVAVVSYVINNGPRPVAQATRQRVLDAIKATGYRPNAVARALASGSTKTFGLIVPNISNPFVAAMAHALLQESFNCGHVMLLGDSGDDQQRERELVQSLLSRQVDGLFYTSVNRQPFIDQIKSSGTPFILLDSVDEGQQVSMLRIDERDAAYRVTRHLLSHGYRKVGIISGPPEMNNARDRYRGWQDALVEQSVVVHDAWVFPAEYTREGGYQAALRMLSLGDLPEALFASNEAQAIGFIRALSERQMRVPDDIALVCFNGTVQSAYHVPALTTTRQPVREMARGAIEMIKAWNGDVMLREFSHYLEIGESCGCQRNTLHV